MGVPSFADMLVDGLQKLFNLLVLGLVKVDDFGSGVLAGDGEGVANGIPFASSVGSHAVEFGP